MFMRKILTCGHELLSVNSAIKCCTFPVFLDKKDIFLLPVLSCVCRRRISDKIKVIFSDF